MTRNFMTGDQAFDVLVGVLRGSIAIAGPGEFPVSPGGSIRPKPDGTGWTVTWFDQAGAHIYDLFPREAAGPATRAEIDVSPDMIKAGLYELAGHGLTDDMGETVESVFRAMRLQQIGEKA